MAPSVKLASAAAAWRMRPTRVLRGVKGGSRGVWDLRWGEPGRGVGQRGGNLFEGGLVGGGGGNLGAMEVKWN